MHLAIWTKYISSNIQISFQIFSFRAAASRAEQIYLAFCFCPLFIERQLLPRLSSATSHNPISSWFIMRFGQIHFAIWTNTFVNLDKYIWLFGLISHSHVLNLSPHQHNSIVEASLRRDWCRYRTCSKSGTCPNLCWSQLSSRINLFCITQSHFSNLLISIWCRSWWLHEHEYSISPSFSSTKSHTQYKL